MPGPVPVKVWRGKVKFSILMTAGVWGGVGLREAFPEPQPRKVAGQNMICEVAPNYILPPACLCFGLGPSAQLPPHPSMSKTRSTLV